MTMLKKLRDFYAAIPEEKWCTGAYHRDGNRHCAIGHVFNWCADNSLEIAEWSAARNKIHKALGATIEQVNDGLGTGIDAIDVHDNPKDRVVAALDIILAKEEM